MIVIELYIHIFKFIPFLKLLFLFFSAFDILELFILFLLRLIIINKSNITQNKRMKPPPTAIAINVGPEKKSGGSKRLKL